MLIADITEHTACARNLTSHPVRQEHHRGRCREETEIPRLLRALLGSVRSTSLLFMNSCSNRERKQPSGCSSQTALDNLFPLPIPRSSEKACAQRHHAAEGGIALLMLPATLHLRRSGGRHTKILEEVRGGQRLRVLERADLHGGRRRAPGRGAARAGLHGHRHRRQLFGCLADELVGGGERRRRARWGAGGHAAEPWCWRW